MDRRKCMKPLTDMSLLEKSREFAERCGIKWHELSGEFVKIYGYDDPVEVCWCGRSYCSSNNPDFSDPVLVLREMKRILPDGDYLSFLDSCIPPWTNSRMAVTVHWVDYFIEDGLLLTKAVEWMRGRE
jgi:hypothetical protein